MTFFLFILFIFNIEQIKASSETDTFVKFATEMTDFLGHTEVIIVSDDLTKFVEYGAEIGPELQRLSIRVGFLYPYQLDEHLDDECLVFFDKFERYEFIQ